MRFLRSISVKYIVAPLAALLLAGCDSQELYSKLTERQANEMVAALRAAGIKAEKKSAEGSFSVLTAAKDFPAAVNTLKAQGLPREQFDTLGKIFKREGFVSSPTEERARMLHALSQELSNTIANIDGVITARVHLAVPEKNPLVDKAKPSGASIFIKHRSDIDLTSQVAQIKALVVNSIEGLPYDNVTVALFPADATPAEGAVKSPAGVAKVKQVSAQAPAAPRTLAAPGTSTAVILASGGAGGLLLLGGGGFLWLRRRNEKPVPLAAKRDFATALHRAAAK